MVKNSLPLLFSLITALFCVLVLSTPANAIPITECMNITQPGTYELVNNITLSSPYVSVSTSRSCISILTSGVVIDGRGYTLYSEFPKASVAIGYNSMTRDVLIKNMTIIDFNSVIREIHGLSTTSTRNITLTNITVYRDYELGVPHDYCGGCSVSPTELGSAFFSNSSFSNIKLYGAVLSARSNQPDFPVIFENITFNERRGGSTINDFSATSYGLSVAAGAIVNNIVFNVSPSFPLSIYHVRVGMLTAIHPAIINNLSINGPSPRNDIFFGSPTFNFATNTRYLFIKDSNISGYTIQGINSSVYPNHIRIQDITFERSAYGSVNLSLNNGISGPELFSDSPASDVRIEYNSIYFNPLIVRPNTTSTLIFKNIPLCWADLGLTRNGQPCSPPNCNRMVPNLDVVFNVTMGGEYRVTPGNIHPECSQGPQQYHSECNANNQCVQVFGPGPNTCSVNSDCAGFCGGNLHPWDYNQDGVVNVQDIFSFLTDWFRNCDTC